jgi:hypothetical protein
METKSPLPHSQEPATCPYLDPDQSSPCSPSHFLKMHFNIIPNYYQVFQVVSFHQVSPPKPGVHLSSTPCVLHAPFISCSLILSPE